MCKRRALTLSFDLLRRFQQLFFVLDFLDSYSIFFQSLPFAEPQTAAFPVSADACGSEQKQNQKRTGTHTRCPPSQTPSGRNEQVGASPAARATHGAPPVRRHAAEPQPAGGRREAMPQPIRMTAEDVHCPGGNTTDQQKGKLRGSVFGQIAGIFKGRKADRERKGGVCHLLFLRFKDQKK